MGVLEFVSVVIGHLLAWPVILLVVVMILRKPLVGLIGRIRTYEGLGQKLTFGAELAEAEESVDVAVESLTAEATARDGAGAETPAAVDGEATKVSPTGAERRGSARRVYLDAAVRNAQVDPSYAVLTSWEQLLEGIADLAGATIPSSRRRSATHVLGELERVGIVNQEFTAAVKRLRDLRNRVAHGQHNPTAGEAVAYVESAEELRRAAHVLADLSIQQQRRTQASETG